MKNWFLNVFILMVMSGLFFSFSGKKPGKKNSIQRADNSPGSSFNKTPVMFFFHKNLLSNQPFFNLIAQRYNILFLL